MMLFRITGPFFCAGVELRDNYVICCAPILNYMRGWTRKRLLNYVRDRDWKAEEIPDGSPLRWPS